MTDIQKAIFQKMMEGKVILIDHTYFEESKYFFSDRYTNPDSDNWDDYNKAWKAYEDVPLVKALK